MVLTTPAVVSKSRTLSLSLHLPGLEPELPLAEPVLAIIALDDALASVVDNRVEPCCEPEARLGDLLRDDGDGGVVVSAAELLVAHGIGAVGDDGGADEGVGVVGPQHGAVDGLLCLEALGPRLALLLVHAALDLAGQVGSPFLRIGEGEAANQLLGDGGVPGGVQVGVGAVEGDVDEVSADFEVLDVQRLVDVAQEVDHPLQRLLLLDEADILGHGACRVVGNGRHDATFLWAIALVDDVALLGRCVQGINVVQRGRELSLVGVAVAVSLDALSVPARSKKRNYVSAYVTYPSSDIRKVSVRGVIQDTLSKLLRVLRDEVRRNVRNSCMAEGAPSVRRGRSGHAGQESRLEMDHLDRRAIERSMLKKHESLGKV